MNDYTTLTAHVYNSTTFVISDKWFQTLPEKYRTAIAQAARESIKIGHGIAALQAIDGWNASCELFKECYILPQTEKDKMAAIARPAWKKWITEDFGVSGALVDDFWAEVSRISKEVTQTSIDLYAK